MATNLVVLGENAARINVKVNPNMTILKVLELACAKMKINCNDYDLKYHNKILDTTSLIRFTNIANNALLELVPATKSRQDSPVGIWLQIEDGSRLSGEFLSSQSLWEVIQTLLKGNFTNYESPAIIYTRMEIIGKDQLKQKTLKDIGLVSGKALLRLLNKKESEDQAHVYVPAARKPKLEESPPRRLGHGENKTEETLTVKPENLSVANNQQPEPMDVEPDVNSETVKNNPLNNLECQKDLNNQTNATDSNKKPTLTDEDLNNFKSSISYLDERNTLLFDIMDGTSVLYQDEGDEFFEPTVKDVNLVLRDLKNSRAQYENGQLCTSAMREFEKTQNQLNLLHKYKTCIIRIHFPNRLVLQSVFKTTETVLDIINFIRKYLVDDSLDFCLFTAPPKTILKPEETLLECGCVPSAMVHFSCSTEMDYLKPDLMKTIVTGCQASIAAYLVRKERMINSSNNKSVQYDDQPGPSQRLDDQPGPSRRLDDQPGPSRRLEDRTGNQSIQRNNKTPNKDKMPKWFKPL